MKRQELVDWEDRGEHLAPGLSDGQMSAGRSGREAPDCSGTDARATPPDEQVWGEAGGNTHYRFWTH